MHKRLSISELQSVGVEFTAKKLSSLLHGGDLWYKGGELVWGSAGAVLRKRGFWLGKQVVEATASKLGCSLLHGGDYWWGHVVRGGNICAAERRRRAGDAF